MKPSRRRPKIFVTEDLMTRAVADFRLVDSVYPAGMKMAAHGHDPAFFSFVLRGAYTERCGPKLSRTCVPSSLIFHPPDSSHAVEFHTEDVSIFRVELKQERLEQIREHYGRHMTASRDFRGGPTSFLSLRIYREFQQGDSFSPLAIEGLVLELIAETLRSSAQGTERSRPRWLERAREMLHAQSHEAPTLTALAAEVGVNPIYLARTFRKRYGCTVGEYVRRLRIDAACREISASPKSLSEIAAASGFYDQSHFSNAFKRYTGMTPAEFRARFGRS